MKKKGAALLTVLIVMVIVFLMAGLMVETVLKHKVVAESSLDSIRAYYSAEAGIYDSISYVEANAAAGVYSANSTIGSREDNPRNAQQLFSDDKAYYQAYITLNSVDVANKTYSFIINSTGTYNQQRYIINDSVNIYFDSNSGLYKFTYTSKKSAEYGGE